MTRFKRKGSSSNHHFFSGYVSFWREFHLMIHLSFDTFFSWWVFRTPPTNKNSLLLSDRTKIWGTFFHQKRPAESSLSEKLPPRSHRQPGNLVSPPPTVDPFPVFHQDTVVAGNSFTTFGTGSQTGKARTFRDTPTSSRMSSLRRLVVLRMEAPIRSWMVQPEIPARK